MEKFKQITLTDARCPFKGPFSEEVEQNLFCVKQNTIQDPRGCNLTFGVNVNESHFDSAGRY